MRTPRASIGSTVARLARSAASVAPSAGIAAGFFVACVATFGCRSATEFGREAVWPTPQRGAIVSEHPLATQVGLDVLDAGGNAADAAVATALALAVVYPQAGNLGGGGFALYVPHAGAARALDFRECAPGAASAAPYLDAAGTMVPERSLRGPLSVAVPGSPAGLVELHAACGSGKLSFEELCRPAIRLAREGFAVDAWLARDLAEPGVEASFNAPARELFFPRGRALREGDRLVQPDLARTLETLASEGARGFYRGPIADAIVSELARAPIPFPERGSGRTSDAPSAAGWMTHEDLAGYATRWREPLKGWFRGNEIVTMPPPSAGGIVILEVLGVLEGLPLENDRNDTLAAHQIEVAKNAATSTDVPGLSERMVHWWIEALRYAFADRAQVMGDPDFVTVPVTELTSSEWVAERRISIGDDARVDVKPWGRGSREGGETTHVSVLDSSGNACSLTTTLNTTFGSGTMVAGVGILLNDEMDDFSIQSGAPNTFGLVGGEANAIQPRKRPLSSMTPTVLREGGHVNVMVLGSPGGPRITTAIVQVLLRTLLFGSSIEDAVRAPRFHQQWSPPETRFEPGFDPGIVGALRDRRSHPVAWSTTTFASVQAIQLTEAGGEPRVVSDPRRGGSAGVQGRPRTTPARPPKP